MTDVNEAPTDVTLSNNAIAENSASGSTVGTFSTVDPEPGDAHVYDLVPGSGDTDNASFTITGNQLKTAAVFNYETKSSYSIRVRASELAPPFGGGQAFYRQFTINITDVNEAPTDIGLSGNSIAENSASGTVVGNLSTTDPDSEAPIAIAWLAARAVLITLHSRSAVINSRLPRSSITKPRPVTAFACARRIRVY